MLVKKKQQQRDEPVAETKGDMTLGGHLRELRRRAVWAVVGIAVGAVAGWFLYPVVFDQMSAPLGALEARGQVAAINFGSIGSAFDLQIRVALVLGLFLTSPWWVWQLFAFVSPGLRRREKLYVIAFGVAGALLFVAGGVLGWFVLPNAVSVLTAFTPDSALNLMDARVYLGFFVRVVTVFGVAFLVPLVLVGANVLGAVSGRSLLRGWRWSVLASFMFAAVANPLPDAWSMIAMAIPICALYFVAIGIALLNDRRRAKRLLATTPGERAPIAAGDA